MKRILLPFIAAIALLVAAAPAGAYTFHTGGVQGGSNWGGVSCENSRLSGFVGVTASSAYTNTDQTVVMQVSVARWDPNRPPNGAWVHYDDVYPDYQGTGAFIHGAATTTANWQLLVDQGYYYYVESVSAVWFAGFQNGQPDYNAYLGHVTAYPGNGDYESPQGPVFTWNGAYCFAR